MTTSWGVPPGTRAGLLARSAALGTAAGLRASLGALAPALLDGSPGRRRLLTLAAVGELAADKLPQAPSRLEAPSQAGRALSGALGAAGLARHDRRSPWLPAVVGTAGAYAGTIAGAVWRDAAADRGWTWQAALVEDAVALGLVALVVRRSRRRG